MRRVALCAMTCLVSSTLYASSGTEGAAFLDIPVGAGPAALGSAYSALASDAYAPIYNPAGLGFVSSPQLAAQHLSYLEALHYEFGSFVIPLQKENSTRALGGSIQYLGAGDFTGTDPLGAPTGSFSAHYAAYSLAYGQQILDSLSLGLSGKLIEAKIDDTSARAYAADLGALYNASDKLSLSATLNNLGSQLKFTNQGDPLPMAFHAGAAYHVRHHLQSTAEMVYSKTGLLSGRFGTEWTPIDMISLRAGYKTDTVKELSPIAGLTLGLGLHLFGQEFAYAWLPYGDLGDTQYFSLLLKFGAKDDQRKNLIQYQDIKRHRNAKNESWGANPQDRDREERLKADDDDYQQLIQLMTTNDPHLAEDHSEHSEDVR